LVSEEVCVVNADETERCTVTARCPRAPFLGVS
jgi:hypothetical protein